MTSIQQTPDSSGADEIGNIFRQNMNQVSKLIEKVVFIDEFPRVAAERIRNAHAFSLNNHETNFTQDVGSIFFIPNSR